MKKLIILALCFFVAYPAVVESQTSRSRSATSSYVIRGQAPENEGTTFYTLDEAGKLVPLIMGAQGLQRAPAPKSSTVIQVSYDTQERTPTISQAGGAGAMLDAEEQQFIAELNNLRSSLGLPPIIVIEQIVRDCRNWSAYLQRTGSFYHGSNQENIAMGHEDGSATFQQWRRSPGHNAKLCNRNDMVAGIGRAGNVWTYRAVPSLDAYRSGKIPQ